MLINTNGTNLVTYSLNPTSISLLCVPHAA